MDHATDTAPANVEKVTPPAEMTPDEWADRLIKLLDVATDAVRKGDGELALMCLAEGVQTAPVNRIPPDP